MGLRYEFNAPPVDADDRMRIFDQDTDQIVQVGTNGVPRSGIESDYNNVAPRVGFNYDLTGMGTTMLQGGYGLFYNIGTLIETSALYFNPPYFGIGLYFPSRSACSRSRIRSRARPSARSRRTTRSTRTCGRRTRTRASLGVEHAFAKTTVDARYVGSFGDGAGAQAQHQPGACPGPARSRRGGRCRSTATS